MEWTTRTHWLWGILAPARFYLLPVPVAVYLLLLQWQWSILTALVLLGIALTGFIISWVNWQTFSIIAVPGEHSLLERDGFAMVSERHINLNMVGSLVFRQSLLGRLLDYGSLSIVALGGPYEWRNIGRFRTLRRIVESGGSWAPER
jgi:uncharacterized membrane protein YdbT with pleckstrin-like domain